MRSHAANPVADDLGDGRVRFYFGCRDGGNRSHIGTADVELAGDRFRVVGVPPEPVLAPGGPGLFDDSGTSMGCLVRDGARRLLYYVGWNLGVTVPWRNSIGLAVAERPGGAFAKVSRAPVLDRSDDDPFSLSYPWVLRAGPVWRMWYGSNTAWGPREADMRHVIKYAESADGVRWERTGRVAIGLAGGDETVVCRPCVRPRPGGYEAWFCARGASYRLGYAESPDGLTWDRQPPPGGVEPTPGGWDGEMIAYPCVFGHAGRTYMAYNGDGYGRAGFGLAVAESGAGTPPPAAGP
jgi:hypothetical protein